MTARGLAAGLCLWAWTGGLPAPSFAQVPSVGPSGCAALCPGSGSPVSSHRRDRQAAPASPDATARDRERSERRRQQEEAQRKAFRELETEIARARGARASSGLVGVELPEHIVYGSDVHGGEVYKIGPGKAFAMYGIEPRVPTGYTPGATVGTEALGRALAIFSLAFRRAPGGGFEIDPEGGLRWENVSAEDAWFLANQAGFALEGKDLQVDLKGGASALTGPRLAEARVLLDRISSLETALGRQHDRGQTVLEAVSTLVRRRDEARTADERARLDAQLRKLAEEYEEVHRDEERSRAELKESEEALVKVVVPGEPIIVDEAPADTGGTP